MTANTLLPVGSGCLCAALLKNACEISGDFIRNKTSKLNVKFGEFTVDVILLWEERKGVGASKN